MVPALAAAVAAATLDWVALPVASYTSDDGFAAGAVARAQWLGEVQPYRAKLGAQILFSTGGVQSHYLRLDAPRLLGTPLRLWVRAEFHREVSAPYYGIGNRSSDSLADHPGLSAEHAFTYERTYPQGILAAEVPLGGSGLRVSGLVRYMRVTVHPYAGSLLANERPPGSEGGEELSWGLGLLFDRRDDEAVPSRGYLLEAHLRGAVSGVASDHGYGGATARALGFVPIGDRIVLAGRVEGDLLTAGAPLFELSRFGGIDHFEGVGGQDTVRGVPKARYIGRAKLIASGELRLRTLDAQILGRAVSFALVGFYDSGRVWQLRGDDGSLLDFHSGAGGGLRLSHREVVLRVEAGTSRDRAFNLYLALGNSF